jgi:hypothetical protein
MSKSKSTGDIIKEFGLVDAGKMFAVSKGILISKDKPFSPKKISSFQRDVMGRSLSDVAENVRGAREKAKAKAAANRKRAFEKDVKLKVNIPSSKLSIPHLGKKKKSKKKSKRK